MIVLRDAQLDDLPSILKIYNHAVLTSTATFDLEEQTMEQRKEWYLQHGGNYPILVAESDGQVVGYGSLSIFRYKPAYAQTVESSIYLDENARGQGIGRIIYNELLRRAKELGYHTVIAGIVDGNNASIKLHEKLGFHLIGTFKEVGYKFGAWQDISFYQFLLR